MEVSIQTAYLHATPEFRCHRNKGIVVMRALWQQLWNTAALLVEEPKTIPAKQELYRAMTIIVSSFGVIYLNKLDTLTVDQVAEALELTKAAIKESMMDYLLGV